MPLGVLLRSALAAGPKAAPSPDVFVKDVCHDSRSVTPGALFVAIPGTSEDGAAFVAEAIRRGAVAVVCERPIQVPDNVPLIQVACARQAVSRLAATFFGLQRIQSAGDLRVIGITGTNGKSTIAYMLRAILRAAERPTALWGTIEYDLLHRRVAGNLTTPDPVDLVRQLVEAHAAGARYALMEVSSHSLDQHRTDGIEFSLAVFTNLTRDHLDYHGTLGAYLQAKRRLFQGLSPQAVAVVNADDPANGATAEGCRASVIRYGLSTSPQDHRLIAGATDGPGNTEVRGIILSESRSGGRFLVQHHGESLELYTPLVGRHNISNALAAAAAALALGVDSRAIRQGLADLTCVPGRLQRVDTGPLGFDVFVDYAHTDDALRNVLRALRPLTSGRLWCVFGCGGDRDRTKRPLMARAVAEGADAFVMTSDNPRTEDPLAIIEEIQRGLCLDDRGRGRTEPDRARAIVWAIEQLAAGDTLLIAGKGHEDYQILGTRKVPFDDAQVAAEAIARR